MIEMPSVYSDGARLGVSKGIEEQFAGEKNIYPCFVYRTNDYDYFQYINRAEDPRESRELGVEKPKIIDRGLKLIDTCLGTNSAMHDIFAAAGQSWMFTQLIDLYHHNSLAEAKGDDDLRIQLLRTGDDRVADGDVVHHSSCSTCREEVGSDRGGQSKTGGMGRVDNVTGAVGYPNVRKTGVADIGDARSLDELLVAIRRLQTWMNQTKQIHGLIPVSGSPWKTALSPEAVRHDREGARKVGFMKPDLDLAKDVGAALRQYDKTVWSVNGTNTIPPKNRCGFTTEEIKLGLESGRPYNTNPEKLAEGRERLKQLLIASCGLDPKNRSHIAMVDDAYDVLYKPGEDKQSDNLGRRQLTRKAELAKSNLSFIENSTQHQEQVERHQLFNDVKHLLMPAEQEGGALTPYVMTAYLSEYFISHLLLTGTYFCKDKIFAWVIIKELSLGWRAGISETPRLLQLHHVLLQGCAAAVIGFCGLPLNENYTITKMLAGFANFWKLARQVAFFMTEAYVDVIIPFCTIDSDREEDFRKPEINEQDTKSKQEMVRLKVFDTEEVSIDDKEHRMQGTYTNKSWNNKGRGPVRISARTTARCRSGIRNFGLSHCAVPDV